MAPVHCEHIPGETKAIDQWLTWIWPAPNKKLPCSVETGEVDDATNPAIYGSFEAAFAAYLRRQHAGIGFALTENDPYVGIDLDDCVQDGKIIHPDAQAIVDSIGGWWDISPSGTGLKTIVRGQVPSSATGKTPGGLKVEIYPAKRFFTLTGQSFEGRPAVISTVNGELTQLYEQLKPHTKHKAETPRPLPQATVDADFARRYAIAALEGEQQTMLAAGEGERHNTRRKAAYSLAGYIPHITAQEIFDALAVNFGPDRKSAEKTIWDSITAGKEEPRPIPEPEQPTFDADGYACCPTHRQRLVACRNGNGYRCPAPKQGHPLCFWWKGEGYTPPEEHDDLDDLDADALRRRLRAVAAERDHWRARADQLARELDQVRERNRFVTQTHGAEGIGAPSKRLTFSELKKELDRVPVEERRPDQFVKVRPAYMAACTGQNRTTISRHLGEMEQAGLIEKKVERVKDPATGTWCAETFVRPLVDLSDPTKVVIPSKPRGKQACKQCGSEQLVREIKVYCAACAHVQSHDVDLVNLPAPDVQTALQEQSDDAATFFESLPDPVRTEAAPDVQTALQDAPHPETHAASLKCNVQHKEKPTAVCVSEVQSALLKTPTTPPPIDAATAPGVIRGFVAADDPWFAYQQAVGGRRRHDDPAA
ncbi:MAG: hypothetical protein M3380_09495 [Chloroflexota bacterium]|nr:hypothetical protein [Chloroflexota bacterium]